MSYISSYKKSDWKAVCQRCGRIFKGSELLRTWDGLYVCAEDWEPKHPQLSVRGVTDTQRVPFTYRATEVYIAGDGYWAFDPSVDTDYSTQFQLNCYATETNGQDRTSPYVEGSV